MHPEANSRDRVGRCSLRPMADGEGIRSYHEQTKHSPARLRSDPHMLDWGNMPRPFKVYPDLDGLPLPHDLAASARPALTALLDPGPATKSAVDRGRLARPPSRPAGVPRHARSP